MSLGLKKAVVAGFATVFSFTGGGGDEPVTAGSVATAVPPTAADTSNTSAPRVDSRTQAAVQPPPLEILPPASGNPGAPSGVRLNNGVLSDAPPETTRDQAASSFAAEVLRLSSEADKVDDLWQVYKDKCRVQVGRQYAFGREWFSVIDRAAAQTVGGQGCDDLLRRLRQAGENLGREIQQARTAARQAFLDRGTENGMLRWHALHWPQFDDEDGKP